MKTSLVPSENLSRKIQSLESDIKRQQERVHDSVDELMHSLQPRNLIRSMVHGVVSNKETRTRAITAGAGVIGAALLKNLLPRALGAVASAVISRIRNRKSKKPLWKR